MMRIKNIKIDPFTGEQFESKRDNQIFASRKNQIRFNNRKAKADREHKAQVNIPMANNRKVLKGILQNQIKIQRSRDFMLGAGFDFNFITHRRIDENGIQWSCVYEFQFREIEKDQFLIQETFIKENI